MHSLVAAEIVKGKQTLLSNCNIIGGSNASTTISSTISSISSASTTTKRISTLWLVENTTSRGTVWPTKSRITQRVCCEGRHGRLCAVAKACLVHSTKEGLETLRCKTAVSFTFWLDCPTSKDYVLLNVLAERLHSRQVQTDDLHALDSLWQAALATQRTRLNPALVVVLLPNLTIPRNGRCCGRQTILSDRKHKASGTNTRPDLFAS